jgi:hypothetical protein
MDAETRNHIEELHHRFAALTIVLTDAMAVLADLAPNEFSDIVRRHRLLVQAIENGTFQSGDRSLLEGHRFVRDLLEKAQERARAQ